MIINKVYHLADLHIRNLKRHKEYREVFNKFLKLRVTAMDFFAGVTSSNCIEGTPSKSLFNRSPNMLICFLTHSSGKFTKSKAVFICMA